MLNLGELLRNVISFFVDAQQLYSNDTIPDKKMELASLDADSGKLVVDESPMLKYCVEDAAIAMAKTVRVWCIGGREVGVVFVVVVRSTGFDKCQMGFCS